MDSEAARWLYGPELYAMQKRCKVTRCVYKYYKTREKSPWDMPGLFHPCATYLTDMLSLRFAFPASTTAFPASTTAFPASTTAFPASTASSTRISASQRSAVISGHIRSYITNLMQVNRK